MTDVTPMGLLALLNTLTLLVTSLLLIYPVLRYATNVAHTTGFVSLAFAFFLLTVAAVHGLLSGRTDGVSMLIVAASLFALLGSFAFARPFLPGLGRPVSLREFADDADAGESNEPSAYEGPFDGREGT
ncbi:MAG: hypothetical protein ABEH90_06900 [Halolamina sp.]